MSHIISKIWENLAKERSDTVYIKASKEDEVKARSLPYRWFYNKALRLAVVFREDLKLVEGSTVAFMSTEPDEYALLLTACWIAGLVAVPIPSSSSLDLQIHYLNNTRSQAFVFPPAVSAKLVSLFSKIKSVKHWCVMGTAARGAAPVAGIIRLEDLARSQIDEFKEAPRIGPASPALVIKSDPLEVEDSFITFSQAQLVEAGKINTSLYAKSFVPPEEAENSSEKNQENIDEIAWASFPLESLDGIVHNFLGPLFQKPEDSNYCMLVSSSFEPNRLWSQIISEDISLIVVNQLELRALYRRAILRNWRKPSRLTVLLYASETLSVDLIEQFQSKTKFSIQPFYRKTILGGALTSFPADCSYEYRDEWLCDYEIPSSGVPLPGVTFQVRNSAGNPLADQTLGELVVRTTIGGIFKKLPDNYAPDISFLKDDFVKTGDEGFIIKDEEGQSHIFVVGRMSDVIVRLGQRISPGRIANILSSLKEVEHALVLGFPNRHVGYEVGAYVILSPAAQSSEKNIKAKLKEQLDWIECPKVIILGQRDKKGFPKKDDVVAHFERYFEVNYIHES